VTDTFEFRPSARLQRYLGQELIADPNVAVLEFVKNAYDAGAAHVIVRFSLSTEPTSLIIADDGIGMGVRSFRSNWMRPGFSKKASIVDVRPSTSGLTAAERREAGRIPVGEKGIGRLAAGRLGERLVVFSRPSPNQPWLHVTFDWSEFDDMNKAMDEVHVPYDRSTRPADPPFTSGTILEISGLSQPWHERIRGRALRGRRRTRLGRLKQDLEFLVRPLAAQGADFEIWLDSDMVREADDIGVITPMSAATDAEYSYAFSLSNVGGQTEVRRTVTRSTDASQVSGNPRVEELEVEVLTPVVAERQGRPVTLDAGPFEGRFLYNPPPAAKRAREIDESPVGVLLYRDGVLVEPYGIGDDDWLGARARKAQRQGHAAIQPDTFFGYVLISKRRNPALRDQTNRLGLIETPASENFIDHVRAEFRAFESLLYGEVLEPRWEGNREAEAQRRAQESQERAAILLRSLAHSLRQPLQGLGWEFVSLRELASRAEVDSALRERLNGIYERGQGHIRVAEQLIQPLLDTHTPEFATVGVRELIERAVAQVRLLAESRGVDLAVARLSSSEVLVPQELVVQALAALIHNAIEAPRPSNRMASVEVASAVLDGNVRIEVRDNGTGIIGPIDDFAAIDSTKGRPASGLVNAELAIVAARGRLRIVETDPDGTRIEVVLPTRAEGLGRARL
jgi:signal transduction histidine kinase